METDFPNELGGQVVKRSRRHEGKEDVGCKCWQVRRDREGDVDVEVDVDVKIVAVLPGASQRI